MPDNKKRRTMSEHIELNPNPIVQFLQKMPAQFTKADIIRYIEENNIQMVNFRYAAGDGRLKTLNFVISNKAYLDQVLTSGERVDGSSLFSFMEAGSSDLYVIPRFSTAFVDPFASLPTICFLCSYFDKDGNFLETSPEHSLYKACKAFEEVTGGMEFWAMGTPAIVKDFLEGAARLATGIEEKGNFKFSPPGWAVIDQLITAWTENSKLIKGKGSGEKAFRENMRAIFYVGNIPQQLGIFGYNLQDFLRHGGELELKDLIKMRPAPK